MEYQDGWTLEQAKAKYRELLQSHYSLCWKVEVLNKDLSAANLQVGVMRTLLENADLAWAQSWDCSAHPGHRVMHKVMPMINEYLTTTEKRIDEAVRVHCLTDLGDGTRCWANLPCQIHG